MPTRHTGITPPCDVVWNLSNFHGMLFCFPAEVTTNRPASPSPGGGGSQSPPTDADKHSKCMKAKKPPL